MSNSTCSSNPVLPAKNPAEMRQEKRSLLNWLKRRMPWFRTRKKKGMEIYPLF